MTSWTAIVPLKLGHGGKSRLAPLLSPEKRQRLVQHMAGHVISELGKVEAIGDIAIIADQPNAHWPVRHVLDHGRGLNRELDAVAASLGSKLLVIHGDLPLIDSADICALIETAQKDGAAIAPDRHSRGTNALALRDLPQGFRFAFGQDSLNEHRAALGPTVGIVIRCRLGIDIDTPDDLALALSCERGFLAGMA